VETSVMTILKGKPPLRRVSRIDPEKTARRIPAGVSPVRVFCPTGLGQTLSQIPAALWDFLWITRSFCQMAQLFVEFALSAPGSKRTIVESKGGILDNHVPGINLSALILYVFLIRHTGHARCVV